LQTQRLVIEVEHGQVAFAGFAGCHPHAHLLEACRQMFERMIAVTALIDCDDLLVGDQGTCGIVQLGEIGAEDQR
jgi:hypothetical protein